MIDETLKELRKGYDVFVCAAAIADYTPKNPVSGKIKSGSELTLKLSPTEKLTRLAREAFPKLFIVGFKAEVNVSEDLLIKYARNKLVAEGLNIIVANDVGKHKFGSDETEVIFLKGSNSYEKRGGSKKDIAKYLLDLIEKSV
jgi:phosphopantothenoylcysteine decarboxylase/phosphopantothenate--cysteine ligase